MSDKPDTIGGMTYGQLLEALRKDLLLDPMTDLLPSSGNVVSGSVPQVGQVPVWNGEAWTFQSGAGNTFPNPYDGNPPQLSDFTIVNPGTATFAQTGSGIQCTATGATTTWLVPKKIGKVPGAFIVMKFTPSVSLGGGGASKTFGMGAYQDANNWEVLSEAVWLPAGSGGGLEQRLTIGGTTKTQSQTAFSTFSNFGVANFWLVCNYPSPWESTLWGGLDPTIWGTATTTGSASNPYVIASFAGQENVSVSGSASGGFSSPSDYPKNPGVGAGYPKQPAIVLNQPTAGDVINRIWIYPRM